MVMEHGYERDPWSGSQLVWHVVPGKGLDPSLLGQTVCGSADSREFAYVTIGRFAIHDEAA